MSLPSPSAAVGAAVTLDGTLAALLMQDGSVWHLWRPRSQRVGDNGPDKAGTSVDVSLSGEA